MPSAQDFENRLRHEARQTLAPHLQSLRDELQTVESRLSASLRLIEQKVSILEVVDFTGAADTLKEALAHVLAKSAEDSRHLARFALDMRQSETQEEILTLLLDSAARFAPRAALFVLRGGQLAAWASRGYSEEAAAAITSQAFPVCDSQLLSRALEGDDAVSANDISAESRLVPLLHEEQQGPWHAFPLKALRRPVAVLLATASNGRECEIQPLSAMIQITGLCIENVALRILQQLRASGTPATAVPPREDGQTEAVKAPPPAPMEEIECKSAPPEPAVAAGPAEPMTSAITEERPAQPAGSPEAVVPDTPEPGAPEEAVAFDAAEIPAAETSLPEAPAVESPVQEGPAEKLEVADAVQTIEEASVAEPAPSEEAPVQAVAPAEPVAATEAPVPEAAMSASGSAVPIADEPPVVTGPVLVQPPSQPEASPAPPRPAAPREVQKPSEEEKLHSDAKRFARLLVSEIKLYNEQRVVEGRVNRDVYVRLKRDIDRSRDLYEKRVSPVVLRKVDYFHDEIIRILGENDASALGSDYPGPRDES